MLVIIFNMRSIISRHSNGHPKYPFLEYNIMSFTPDDERIPSSSYHNISSSVILIAFAIEHILNELTAIFCSSKSQKYFTH